MALYKPEQLVRYREDLSDEMKVGLIEGFDVSSMSYAEVFDVRTISGNVDRVSPYQIKEVVAEPDDLPERVIDRILIEA